MDSQANKLNKSMKDFFKILFMLALVIFVYIFRNDISYFITEKIVYKDSHKVLSYNEYFQQYDYSFVQNTDITKASNYQELINLIYTIINSGDETYTFYCNYQNCKDDVKTIISENSDVITDINNFVHPYNSFSSINIDLSASGKVIVTVNKVYSNEMIQYVNGYIDKFINENINNSMSTKEKIKVFHDHIINNTIYDEAHKERSSDAYELLSTGKAICGGYSDAMAIYLTRIGVQNYKIVSAKHVWNLVNINGKWLHLDATWDDPVASDGNQYLLDTFFLIDTNKLLELDTVEHTFNKEVFKEAN